MMHWLPKANSFRDDLRAAVETPAPADRLERLAALASHRLDFLETLLLDRALMRCPRENAEGFTASRLAVLGSSTLDQLAPGIRVAGLRRRLLIDAHTGSYGQWRQELFDASSSLWKFSPQVIVLALAACELASEVPIGASRAEVDQILERSIAELRKIWRQARESLGATVIQQSFLDLTEPLFGNIDATVPGAPSCVVARLNELLAAATSADGVLLLDIARASAREGRAAWFDPGRWFQAKQEIMPSAAPAYGELLIRIVAAQLGLSKKCLVLDLDNTLWGGVVGDDGLEGIVLGNGSAAGEAHAALQAYAKQLSERGVILAVCSKNDPTLAESAFRQHPEMRLRRQDIAAFVANWKDKAENLVWIADTLNIGLDSLVFVDDNPAERARIRTALPMVAVPELPDDAAMYVQCLAAAGYFEAVGFTAEDRQRAAQYSANAARELARTTAGSVTDFLRELHMKVEFGPFAPVDLPRIAQLVNKTNQFNPTTRRYTAHQLTELAASPENVTLQLRLQDRLGDNGLVSAMLLRRSAADWNALELDLWVMSCRVFGRDLETEALNIAVELADRSGARKLVAAYVPTPKNAVVSELFQKLGFNRLDHPVAEHGETHWELDLTAYVPRLTHIARKPH